MIFLLCKQNFYYTAMQTDCFEICLASGPKEKKGICFRASGIQRCFMISVRSMLQKFAEALASRSREGTANVLPLETSIRFPCVTYPKDVSNETAVTVTIRVLVVQFMFISIKNTVPMDRFSWQTRCLNFFQFGTLVKQIQEHMLHKE